MKIEFPAGKDRLDRDDLVDLMAARLDLKPDRAREILVETLGLIVTTVREGKSLSITGFGSFAPVQVKARKGRNPQNGEPVRILSRRVPKFSPGTLFLQYLNGRPLPKTGPIVAKAAKGSGEANADYAKSGVRKRRYIKKEH